MPSPSLPPGHPAGDVREFVLVSPEVSTTTSTRYPARARESRRDWSNYMIIGNHDYAAALEKLTGINADTVRRVRTAVRRQAPCR